MANRLSTETSPYLLQHADNPVDWWPWCDEAFEEARRRDVPVFVSIGYSSCHWCHVMAHESFEDTQTAEVMNDRFVNVKVDREERPDVDSVYMDAVQAMTGHGGWPMSVFVTPDTRQPFYGGTYWPKVSRPGMPSFGAVMDAIDDAWRNRRDEVQESAADITRALQQRGPMAAASDGPDTADELLARSRDIVLERAWDRVDGGFGRAPKFPQAMTIGFLLDHHARTGHTDARVAAVESLRAMARGGIRDHVGGGFARYSTDNRWLVPHFEKMLYDNGLLLAEYARAAALTGDEELRRVAIETGDFLLREMRPDVAAFQAALDADSEGVEGRFYVWDHDELVAEADAAGAPGHLVADWFGVTPQGNWEGTNVLHQPVGLEEFARRHDLDTAEFARQLDAVRRHLDDVRARRVPPGADGKVLTSWNGLAIRGLALSGRHLDVARHRDAAVEAAEFLRDNLVVDDRLHHVWAAGRATVPAMLDDHANLALGLLALFEAVGDPQWFTWAVELADDAVARFRDPDGGYFDTAGDAEQLYRRPKTLWDNATPSGSSALASVAARLAAYTGDQRWVDVAEGIVDHLRGQLPNGATGMGMLAQVLEFLASERREVVIVGAPGEQRDALGAEVHRRLLPGTVIAVVDDDPAAAVVPAVGDRVGVDQPTAWVCRHFACQLPVTEPDDLARQLQA